MGLQRDFAGEGERDRPAIPQNRLDLTAVKIVFEDKIPK